MKGRESGMPDADYWETFFDAEGLVHALVGVDPGGPVLEFGSGYGTFTIPLARSVDVPVIALEIEPELVRSLQHHADTAGLSRLQVLERDFMLDGSGLADTSMGHVMLYNILHIEQPGQLLREAYRVLMPGGSLSLIHWRSDIPTPRGPSLEIRPRAEDCLSWCKDAGFVEVHGMDIATWAPFHFALIARKE